MRPLGIVADQVFLQVLLHFFQGSIELRAPLVVQVLLEQGSVKPFHEPIALRPAGLGYQGPPFVWNQELHVSAVMDLISCSRNSYEDNMRISKRGQVTIPKPLRDRFGMNPNVEVEIIPTQDGLLIQKRTAAKHPVDRIHGIVPGRGSTDDYVEAIRGR